MKKPVLLVIDDWEGRIAASLCWTDIKEEVEIRFLPAPIDATPDADLADVQFLLALRERTQLTEQVFARLPRLKLVLQTGGHTYHIELEAAKRRGIAIALGRHVQSPLVSVPELTMGMMLGLLHQLPQAQQAMKAGQWPLLTGRTLKGRRLGILGMGRHGSRVARIARTVFDMEVVSWARPGSHPAKAHPSAHPGQPTPDSLSYLPRLPLDELLRTSDVVSIHLRLSPESTGLLDAKRLRSMREGSILINTSRGAIIDETALIEVLTNGPLAGAGLDVFAQEPLATDSPLRSLDNVLLTPHIGWTVEEVFEEFAEIACAQLGQYRKGTIPSSVLIFAH